MSTDLQKVQSQCQAFLASVNCVQLATLDALGCPFASYTPFIAHEQEFYIFISDLAEHSQNLHCSPLVSLLFIGDAKEAANVFARERVSMQAQASVVDRTSTLGVAVLDQMERELGKTVGLLRTLDDFKVFKLAPSRARYIVGFGRAYQWDLPSGVFEHITADTLVRNK